MKSNKTSFPRAVSYSRDFYKDWGKLSRSGRFDMRSLKTVMGQLSANDAPLGAEWRDHALKGNWKDHRECHISGDFLLIYRIDDGGKIEIITFVRAGTHADLFK